MYQFVFIHVYLSLFLPLGYSDPPIDPDDSLSEQLNRGCVYFVSEGRFFNRLDHMEVG